MKVTRDELRQIKQELDHAIQHIYRTGNMIDRVSNEPGLLKPEAQPVASTQSHQLDNTIRFEATTAGMEKITHHIKRLSQRVDELENKK